MARYTVDITAFGAAANAGDLQTPAIQAAIDDCFTRGGGTVTVPAGTFRTGGIRLRSHVTLHLLTGAVLRGSRDPEDYFGYRTDAVEPLGACDITDAPYIHLSTIRGEAAYDAHDPRYDFKRIPGSRWNNALIRAIHAEDIAVIGDENAVIDGADCYDAIGEEHYRGPHAICFFDCENIRLSGYTLKNASNWAHNLLFCRNILCEDIEVLAGHDGFDAATCENLVIRNSRFMTGDDCIAGFGNTNVTVDGCEINSACSAMRFAGTNVTVKNCRIYGPGKYVFRGSLTKEEQIAGKTALADSSDTKHRFNMLSVFTYYADYSMPIPDQPGNIIIENCTVENADRFLHYNYSGNETWQRHRPLESITFRGVTAKGLRMPITAYGDKDVPVTLALEDVTISDSKEYAYPALIHACNFRRLTLRGVTVADTPLEVLIKTWSDGGKVEFENVACPLPEDKLVTRTDEKFFCKPI